MTRRNKNSSHHEREKQVAKRYEKHRRCNLLAKPGKHQFVIVLDHLKAGFNVPKIFRSAEVFGAHAVHLIDIGIFDPAAAKGGFKHVPAHFHKDFDSCYQQLKADGYTLYTLEANSQQRLWQTELPEKSAFIFGHEEMGICFDRHDYPDIGTLAVPQFGQIESLNVSVTASVVMYEYVRQRPKSASK